jgi:ATP adenylyltransferase/5',5'''-P-1,P-4-tetraphosphate phosphorylase II
MMVVPRSKAGMESPVPVHVNGFGFIGMLVVRSEEDLIKLQQVGIETVLGSVTFPLPPESPKSSHTVPPVPSVNTA